MRFALNGISIHNFNPKKIEQNFNDTEILDQFRDDSLSEWLEEVGEDDMANRIKSLDKKSPDDELIDAIIGIMGLDRKQLEDTRNRIAAERAVAQKAEMEKLEAEREAKRAVRERESLPDYDKVPDRSIYFEKWKQAAESGDMRAQYNYGMCCENAYERRKWIEQSAEQGYEKALEQLEYLNEMRIGIRSSVAPEIEGEERNVIVVDEGKNAKQKLVDLANQGNANAQYKVGKNFYYGKNGFRQKEKSAIKWWKRAAEQGHAGAIRELDKIEELAKRYEELKEYRAKFKEYTWGNTDDRKTNMTKLLDLACQGDVESQFLVAESFYYGLNGFKENYEKAIAWYQKAADQGYKRATAALREINDFE